MRPSAYRPPSTVLDKPLIQPSRDVELAGTNRTEPSPELRGDLAVHGFWTRSQTAIFDVCITDTDQPSNRNTDPAKVLLRHEKEKKTNTAHFALHAVAPSPH